MRDPLRLVICDRMGLIPARESAAWLSAHGIDIEMADLTRMVLILALDTPSEALDTLAECLDELASQSPAVRTSDDAARLAGTVALEQAWAKSLSQPAEPVLSATGFLLGDLKAEPVELDLAAGRIAAEIIAPYPPGIPLIHPGERIDRNQLELMQKLRENGIILSGVRDGRIRAGTFDYKRRTDVV